MEAIVAKARKDDGVPRTAQQSIPFQRMFPDGICRVTGKLIPKERLRAVPHATLSIEAKQMKNRKD